MKDSKIVIIGVGSVGTAIAYALLIQGYGREIVLIDNQNEKAKAEALDLSHGQPFIPSVTITAGSFKDCRDAEIIIITAGAKQKPDETRIALLNRNLGIMKEIITNITQEIDLNQQESPILLIVSNPCDVLTYYVQKISRFPRSRVIGSGTVLDSARLRFEIAQHCQIDAKNIHGYVIGEHGDSEVILWNSLRIGLSTFGENCANCDHKCNGNVKKEIEDRVKYAAYEIIKAKGFTNFGVGLAVARIVEAITKNQNSILPVSILLEGEYDEQNVALSVPCVINRSGVRNVMQQGLIDSEKQLFHQSAEKLRKIIEQIE
jgi:L-lactate dehydrogenase